MNTEPKTKPSKPLDAPISSAQSAPIASKSTLTTPIELADQYTFIEELGRGTQGHVYKATRKRDNAVVAIKQLRIDSIQTWKEYDLFMREAKTLKSLDIPGVVKFEDALEFLNIEHPAAYIVQEYIPGKSLGEMMRANYRFTTQQIFHFAIKLLTILQKLHHHNPPIIHRDIKPSNILFKPQTASDGFDLYLIDFGAVANPQIQSGGSTVAGTFGYMPPEQLMGKPCPESDIYALGATLAYMLSGVEPASMQVSDFKLMIEPHLETVPYPVVATLRQMLAPNVSERVCDYDDLILRFKQYANNIYSIALSNNTSSLVTDFDEKLKAVSAYGQESNMELWSALSEQTPRSIPNLYMTNNAAAMPNLDSMNQKARKLRKKVQNSSITVGLIFLGMCMSLFLLTLFLFLHHPSHKLEFEDFAPFIVLFIFIALVIRVIYRGIHEQRELKNTYNINNVYEKRFLYTAEVYKSAYSDNTPQFRKVVKLGCKSIATIVDISYKPVDTKLIELFDYTTRSIIQSTTGSVYQHTNTRFSGGYCHQQAAFTIRYKFNPPDDSSPYDLVHEVTTYTDCENTLKPGDLIPILYYINPQNNREVWSTPFPIPYSDLINFKDLTGHSLEL